MIEEGKCGYHCEVGDVKTMAERAAELLGDKQKITRFSAAARERARNEFEPSRIVDTYEDFYLQIIGETSESGSPGSDD